MRNLQLFHQDKAGQDLVEYSLMAGFVALMAGAIVPGVAEMVKTSFARISAEMGRGALGEVGIVAPTPTMDGFDTTTVLRIICAVLAVCFLATIILRRRNQQRDWD